MYPWNAIKGILLLWGAKGFSTEQLNKHRKMRIMSNGAVETAREKCWYTG